MALAAPPWCGGPRPLSPPFLRVLLRPENLSQGTSRRVARSRGRRTPERKELSGRAGIRGNSLPEGEIDAIAIVIELDIISIIIIIISTIYTAITTAAPRHRCIAMNEVRKKLFTISLSGKAAHWYKLLKNGDSIDWEDIVPLFYSKFYPPSEIHKDRNRIYNFWPHDGESIAQAWGRLKSLMLKCPIHELPGNVIIDNFYARLSFQDKTLLDTSCSGSFTRNKEEFKRDLLDRIQENTEGWENDKDRESVKDLVTENVEDGHIIFCEDASNIVSHPNKPKQVSVPMLSVRIGDHCYYGLCDIGASVSAIPYELYTEIMHEIGSCELEDIDVVIHLANRETISPIGIVRDVEVLCKIKYPADFLCASIVLVPNNPLQQHLENSESEAFRKERDELEEIFLRQPILKHDLPVEDLGTTPPPKEDPVFDLKPLPDNLKYAHIDDKKIYPVIISSKLSEIEEERLLEILKKHRGAIGYTLDDLKGISPSICQHAINMEDDAKPVVEHQRRLIPKMKEVRCEETNLVLNWEKCHFMVNEGIVLGHKISERGIEVDRAKVEAIEKMPYPRDVKDKTLLDTTCSGSFTSNKEEFKRDLLDRIKENAEDWENDKGKESGYADKPPFKPLPPKEGNEEKEKKKKKKEGKKKKKKKKENKKKEVTAYPRVNEITLGNRKYVAPNDYCDNESEYDDLPMPFTYISDHDLNEHTTFDIGNLFGTDYEINDDSIIHVPLNDDIESSKLGDVVLEDPVFETSTFSENDDITYSEILVTKYSRNWTKSPPRFLFFHEASRRPKGKRSGTIVAGCPGRAAYGVVAPSTLLRRLFAYIKPPHRKPLRRKPRYEKSSRAAAVAKPRSGGQESLFRHLPERGSALKAPPSTPLPSPPPSSSPPAAPMRRE
ncbi:hypothetical protein QYE76_020444 [Lolium multiflorum]|uniref:Retrotransposon gag domain-containing protein n=1 Tax=Lolium multiflorum TaxID=4521 RepID=A0AAD8VP83_LOLMU|nr:hypothetical protein QYE76_020444 [Lolium multiflorum]